MKIKTINYSGLFNLGNYNNERIELTAQVEEGEDIKTVLEALREQVKSLALPNRDTVFDEISKKRQLLEELEKRIDARTKEWNAISDFLVAQGIKPDSPRMPDFKKLLPQAYSESSEIIEAEIERDNEF